MFMQPCESAFRGDAIGLSPSGRDVIDQLPDLSLSDGVAFGAGSGMPGDRIAAPDFRLQRREFGASL